MTFKARFDGHVLIADEPLNLPLGCTLEVQITSVESAAVPKTPLAKLAELAGKFPPNPDSPGDAAAQRDHYLYGTPKHA